MKRFFIAIIRFYQKHISPTMPPCCRFSPTCSQYGAEAIERFGALRGGAMALYRILRCNPFNAGGYDPVPVTRRRIRKYKTIKYKNIK